MTLETIVRPFQTPVAPNTFHEAGEPGAPPVRLAIGMRGGSKTFSYSGSFTVQTYMVAIHKEKPVPGTLGN